VYCPATDPSQTVCLIPMTALTSSPYSFPYGYSVIARVRARNSLGWSAWSSEGSGATVQTVPQQMGAVTNGALTTNQQIQLMWTA